MTEICPYCREEFWQDECQYDFHFKEDGKQRYDIYDVECPGCGKRLQWIVEYEKVGEYLTANLVDTSEED